MYATYWRPFSIIELRDRALRATVVALSIAVLLAATYSAAAAETLQITSVGWDGTVVPGTWTPVRVTVSGATSDVNARLEVIVKYRQPSPGGPVTMTMPDRIIGAYGQDVALPAGTTKELTIWVPAQSSQGPPADKQPGTVRLVANGQVLATEDIEFRSGRTQQWPLVGALAESQAIARGIRGVTIPYQGLPVPISVAGLNPSDVPTAGERLKAFSAIVVQGAGPALLTGEQRQAVRDWVTGGGHLVVLGGPDAARAAAVLPDGTLPITIAGVNSAASLAPLEAWLGGQGALPGNGPAARIEPQAGSVLLRSGNDPLVWRVGRGDGTVTLLAADPSLEPLVSWRGSGPLIQKLLEPALGGLALEGGTYGYMGDPASRLQSAVDALPPESYPSLPLVAFILGGFALAMGPVAHIILRRLDRREWIWAVVPASSIVVVGILYVVGIGRDGRDVLGNVVANVQLAPEEGGAHAVIAAGYFAPTRPLLTIHAPGSEPLQASGSSSAMGYGYGGYYGGYYGGGGYPYSSGYASPIMSQPDDDEVPFSVISGRDTRIEFPTGQWGMRTVTMDRALGNGIGQISPSLRIEGNLITGTVRNDTTLFLENAAVLVGSSIFKLGSLAPGQTVPVAGDIPAPPTSASPGNYPGYQQLSQRLLGNRSSPGSSSGPMSPMPMPMRGYGGYMPMVGAEMWELPKDPEIVRRARLLDVLNQPTGPYGGSAGTRPVSFVALTRSSLGIPLPNAGTHPLYSLSVAEQRLRLDFQPGAFKLPAGLTPPELMAGSLMSGRVPTPGGPPTAQATYRFRPPLPKNAVVEALEFDTSKITRTPIPSPGSSSPSSPSGGGPVQAVPYPRSGPFMMPGAAEDPTVAIYNWQSGDWDPLTAGQQAVRIEAVDAYLSAEGEVRIQVNSLPMGPMQNTVELVVEGRVLA